MIENMFNITTNEYLPLRDVVFNTLRDAILSGKLIPGERLMENQLAEKLGVSRTPIREALRMLELENLVELVPRKGAQVLDMSEKDIRNVLEIRKSLEELAVGLASQRMGRENLELLKKAQKEFIKAYQTHDYEKIAEADEKFHDIIFKSTENEKLIQIISNLKIQLYRYRMAYLKASGFLTVSVDQHNGLLTAIEKREPEQAKKISNEHISHQTEVILNSIKNDK